MNIITKHPVNNLGYGFIDEKYLPKGKDEYYLRNQQNKNGISYRKLRSTEIKSLVKNGNISDDWNKIFVADPFDAELVRACKFYGLVRIGKLEPYYLEFHNLRMQVGLYNSTIISCDLGNNLCINNANYLSHYIIGNEVMIANVNELATTNYAKFGNGIVKDGETERTRVWMELCNENGGRSVIPFEDMLPGDAYLWSKYRDDEVLLKKFIQLTENQFDKRRGYYGTIGDRTVIKNCKIIKDVSIGTDAYLKGANKLKNLTINSDADRTSQIGEGCEIVNGIVGYGCRIFYGVKAVRFVMSSHSQLKYGARLINSYLGNNSTISCCEVLNSLIFPAHEQHHNNSFLCASLVMGQSNIAAGATLGSNHNSRSADGELVAGRGFWPALCVSLKHNSKFASFCILSKSDFPSELNIPIPFSLISNDVTNDQLVIMPGYWFMYNMYALSRNTWKYNDRDKRINKTQTIEYHYLAPDTINEMFSSMKLLSAISADEGNNYYTEGFENSHRKVLITKLPEALKLFKELIIYYGTRQIMLYMQANKFISLDKIKKSLSTKIQRTEWLNIGGQLMTTTDVEKLKKDIKSDKIQSWQQLHDMYKKIGDNYKADKLNHAYTSLMEILNITPKQFTLEVFKSLLQQSVITREWMCKGIYDSREKDHTNVFRKMTYDTKAEMDKVVGKLEDNTFVQQQFEALDIYKKEVREILQNIQP
ncbi:MAG: DUF4954 family protein [Ginsengibacter sp.]